MENDKTLIIEEMETDSNLGYCCCCIELHNYESLTNYKSELYCKECFSKYSIDR